MNIKIGIVISALLVITIASTPITCFEPVPTPDLDCFDIDKVGYHTFRAYWKNIGDLDMDYDFDLQWFLDGDEFGEEIPWTTGTDVDETCFKTTYFDPLNGGLHKIGMYVNYGSPRPLEKTYSNNYCEKWFFVLP